MAYGVAGLGRLIASIGAGLFAILVVVQISEMQNRTAHRRVAIVPVYGEPSPLQSL